MISRKKSAKKPLFVNCLIIVLLAVSCQGRPEPTPENQGVLEGVPSIGETLGTPVSSVPPLPTIDPAVQEQGKEIYVLHCAACHGLNLEGQPDWKTPNEDGSFKAPPHNEEGHTWHHSDRVLIESVLKGGTRLAGSSLAGTSNMPAFEEILTDGEISAVLTYIKSTWPADIQQIQWERTAAAP